MDEIEKNDHQTPKVLAIGTLIGAIVGLGTAYFIIRNVEEGESVTVDSGQGLKLGMLFFGTLRQLVKLLE